MPVPLFLKLTAEDGTKHYINFYWVAAVSFLEDEEKSGTQILIYGDDEPIMIKESVLEIRQMLDREMAEQKERVEEIRQMLDREMAEQTERVNFYRRAKIIDDRDQKVYGR